MASDSGRTKAGVRHHLSGDFALLRRWRPVRRAGAGIAAAAAAAVVVSMNGMMGPPGAVWWNAVIVAAGSVLTGLVVGSYVDAPIGAEATVCDTRWPLIGLTGLVIATSTGQGTLAAHLFTGAAPPSSGRSDPAILRPPLTGPSGMGAAGATPTRADSPHALDRRGFRRGVHELPAALSHQNGHLERTFHLMSARITNGRRPTLPTAAPPGAQWPPGPNQHRKTTPPARGPQNEGCSRTQGSGSPGRGLH